MTGRVTTSVPESSSAAAHHQQRRKVALNDLAIFGGPCLFEKPRPVGQLDAPPVEDYLELLGVPFEARHLTNDGPLVRRLEKTLSEYHGVRHCIAVANAALGLTMLMQLFASDRKGVVIMPAFSYRGLPHFAQWAGQMPGFCDVDPLTHGLDPAALEAAISPNTTSILSVCNFNDPGPLDQICEIGRKHGLPVILDSVYGIGSSFNGKSLGGFGTAEVYSTHATKLLNGFEGGYITTNDDKLAALLRWQRNFSLPGQRPPQADESGLVLGLNAKLNELHAAMALLSLMRLDGVIERNKSRYQAYATHIGTIAGLALLPSLHSAVERRNFEMVVVDVMDDWPLTRNGTLELLRAEGMAISPYYSPALHESFAATTRTPMPKLPVAENLAKRYIQLPVGEMVSLEDIDEIGALLRFVQTYGTEIANRLGADKSR